jgi:hypothetical protein
MDTIYIRMAVPPHNVSEVFSLAAQCRLTRRPAGGGILTATPIVSGPRMRDLGSTKMDRECRMLRQRPKCSAVRIHNRMPYHYYLVQETTTDRTRCSNSAHQPRTIEVVDSVATSHHGDSDAGNGNYALSTQFGNLTINQGTNSASVSGAGCHIAMFQSTS